MQDLPHLWKGKSNTIIYNVLCGFLTNSSPGNVNPEDYPPLLQLLSYFGIAYVIPRGVPFLPPLSQEREEEEDEGEEDREEEEGDGEFFEEGRRDSVSILSYSSLESSLEMRLFIPSRSFFIFFLFFFYFFIFLFIFFFLTFSLD